MNNPSLQVSVASVACCVRGHGGAGDALAIRLEQPATRGAALAGSLGALLGFGDSFLDQVLWVFGDPAVRQQRLSLGIAERGPPPVDIAEVSKQIDAVLVAALRECEQPGRRFAALFVAEKQPGFLAEHRGLQSGFVGVLFCMVATPLPHQTISSKVRVGRGAKREFCSRCFG